MPVTELLADDGTRWRAKSDVCRFFPANPCTSCYERTTMFVVFVWQGYANYTGEPEAAFTTIEKAREYIAGHHVSDDCRISEVPVDPAHQ